MSDNSHGHMSWAARCDRSGGGVRESQRLGALPRSVLDSKLHGSTSRRDQPSSLCPRAQTPVPLAGEGGVGFDVGLRPAQEPFAMGDYVAGTGNAGGPGRGSPEARRRRKLQSPYGLLRCAPTGTSYFAKKKRKFLFCIEIPAPAGRLWPPGSDH
jgi:hypothetical protein